MGAMDARRLELYEDDLIATEAGLTHKIEAAEQSLTGQMNVRFAQMGVNFAEMDARFDRLESVLTRRMMALLGAWTILVGSTVGWVFALVH